MRSKIEKVADDISESTLMTLRKKTLIKVQYSQIKAGKFGKLLKKEVQKKTNLTRERKG
jgi:hypothetical protein